MYNILTTIYSPVTPHIDSTSPLLACFSITSSILGGFPYLYLKNSATNPPAKIKPVVALNPAM